MKCQICSENNATIHLTEIEKGVKKEVHLCEDCYKEKNSAADQPPPVDELIKNFLKNLTHLADDKSECPVCGATYGDFHKKGVLGCPEDYAFFKDMLIPLLEKVHGAVQHKGKIPHASLANKGMAERLIFLRKELDDVIRN